MNYFSLFELDVKFDMNVSELTKKYYALTKAHHPDHHTLKSEDLKFEALQKTTQINEGYKILKQKETRYKHILELSGIIFEEGKESVPQEFLFEMMEVNEALMEYMVDSDPKMKVSIESKLDSIDEEMWKTIEQTVIEFEFGKTKKEELENIKEYYCLLYTSPSPRDATLSRMPSSA